MAKKTKKQDQADQSSKEVSKLQEQLASIQKELIQAQEGEKRAKADYQNLVRRNQEERAQLAKFANKALVTDLLQPLEHLTIAAKQIDDKGLNIVIDQFWQSLKDNGVEEIKTEEMPFDVNTMEAVETEAGVDPEEAFVLKTVQKGYLLNGQVIQFAKVVVGKKPS